MLFVFSNFIRSVKYKTLKMYARILIHHIIYKNINMRPHLISVHILSYLKSTLKTHTHTTHQLPLTYSTLPIAFLIV